MTTTKNTPAKPRTRIELPAVESRGLTTVGGVHTLRGVSCEILVIAGYTFLRTVSNGLIHEPCGRCDGSGHIQHYAGIYGGVCFECNGAGAHARNADLDAVRERVRRRVRDRHAREQRAAREEAAREEAARTWLAARPNLRADLERVRAAREAGDRSHDGTLAEFAFKAVRAPLSPVQERWAVDLLAAHAAREAWTAVAAAGATYAGDVGDKVEVTGEVKVAYYLASERFDRSAAMLIVVQAGTASVKMTTSATWAFDVNKGDVVTIKATVKGLGEYDGLPQTVLVRPKLIPA